MCLYENENLLFVGTDNGLYVSFDQGKSWQAFQNGLPNVAVHDLVIQSKAKHLLVGTHGRSIYQADISHLQQMTPETLAKDLVIFALGDTKYSKNWGNKPSPWSKATTPGLDVVFYSGEAGSYAAEIQTADDIVVSTTELEADKGLNMLSYDIAFSKTGKASYLKKNKTKLKEAKDGKTYLPKGDYVIILTGNGSSDEAKFKID